MITTVLILSTINLFEQKIILGSLFGLRLFMRLMKPYAFI
jgi:hypothetical protein